MCKICDNMTSGKRHHLHWVGKGSSKTIVIATQQHVISSKPLIVSSNVEIEHVSLDVIVQHHVASSKLVVFSSNATPIDP